jgi:hypothetical protein
MLDGSAEHTRTQQDHSCRTLAFASGLYEIRYQSLFDPGRCLAFPCDAAGRVDPQTLSPRALRNFRVATALVGRDFSTPMVVPSGR